MRKFETSDEFTTSDIGLSIEADSLPELFKAGAEGMFEIILGGVKDRQIETERRIDLQADSNEQLLIDWLSELLYAFDADGLIPGRLDLKITDSDGGISLRSTVGCVRFDPDSDEAEREIKAVTYYKLKIKKDSDVYRCHVVFDL